MSAYIYRAVAILVMTACMSREAHPQNRVITLAGSQRDMISDIAVDANHYSYLSCFTESEDGDFTRQRVGNGDLCVVRLDPTNQVLWKTTVGTFGQGVVYRPIPITANGQQGCFVATSIGWNSSSVPDNTSTGMDMFIARLDTSGNVIWKVVAGGTLDDVPYSLIATEDGGIVIAGYTASRDADFEREGKYRFDKDMFLMKIDSVGIMQWTHTYGGSREDVFTDVRATDDGGWKAVGWSDSDNCQFQDLNKGAEDAILMKIDSNGEVLWARTYGTNGYDDATELKHAMNGEWIIVGSTWGRGWLYNFVMSLFSSEDGDGDFAGKLKGFSDAFVIKVDSNGNILWSSIIGGDDREICNAVAVTHDNDIVMTGSYNSGDGDFEDQHSYGDLDGVFISRFNSNGQRLWIKTIRGSNDEWPTCCAARNGEVLIGVNSLSNDGDFLDLKKGWTDIHVFSVKNE